MLKVIFTDDNIEAEVEHGANLRDVAMKEGSSIPFGCEQGICGTCLVSVPEGLDHRSKKEEQEEETLEAMGAEDNQRLACQCHAEGDVTIEGAL